MHRHYYVEITPSRIGIDFRKKKDKRGNEFIPNIDVADLVRLIRVFQHLKKNKVKSWTTKESFEIFPTFRRRIILGVREENITLGYQGRYGKQYWEPKEVKPSQVSGLISALEEAYTHYVKLIETWHDSAKLPSDFQYEYN